VLARASKISIPHSMYVDLEMKCFTEQIVNQHRICFSSHEE
jgi:hypothetical protein